MLYNRTEGSIEYFLNGQSIGIMKDDLLKTGEYYLTVELCCAGESVKLIKRPAPVEVKVQQQPVAQIVQQPEPEEDKFEVLQTKLEVNDAEFKKVYKALLDMFPRLSTAQKLILSGIVNNNLLIRELAEQAAALNQPQNKFDLSEVLLTLLKANHSIELVNPDLELVNHALRKALQAL